MDQVAFEFVSGQPEAAMAFQEGGKAYGKAYGNRTSEAYGKGPGEAYRNAYGNSPSTPFAEGLDMPFQAFAGLWLREKAIECRASYLLILDWALEQHLFPRLGQQPLQTINRALMLEVRRQLVDAGLCADTVNRIVGLARAIFHEAHLRYGLANPAREIKKLKSSRKTIRPFSLDQARLLIARAPAGFKSYLTVRFFTGLRSAEVHGLRWDRVDLERGEITIDQAWANGQVGPTKNEYSNRVVKLSEVVVRALIVQSKLTLGRSEYVFCARNGNPIESRNFDARVWRPLLKRVGLEARRPYQMRHTCATLWLAAGENPEWIARQLGHADTTMLFRVYSRYVPNLTRQDGSAMDALLRRTDSGFLIPDQENSPCH